MLYRRQPASGNRHLATSSGYQIAKPHTNPRRQIHHESRPIGPIGKILNIFPLHGLTLTWYAVLTR